MHTLTSRTLGLLSLTILCRCAATLPPSAFADGTPELRPETFFAGSTRSSGVLEDRGGAPTRRLRVTGTGTLQPDGSLQLDQSIVFDQDPPVLRQWVLRRLEEHTYAGTLTDASGPVTAEAYGNLFHLRYPMRSPAGGRMEQWLYLQPDGRTVVNEATVRVLGLVVAHISERITHAP